MRAAAGQNDAQYGRKAEKPVHLVKFYSNIRIMIRMNPADTGGQRPIKQLFLSLLTIFQVKPMADIIKLLPDSVANQIAAGEVIQRPSSVVKELVENAVDAGAQNISVIIRDSGKTLIQVVDDGSGMSETDARLAFERHATSKIASAQDLFSIVTKGFRGEALASIAAVSMVELRTRKEEQETGTLVIINASRVESQEPCSSPKGSSFSVKNLFFNVPARRKFLKSDTTELRHIINEFQKISLAHPEIRFTLHHNDTELYNLLPSNNRQRIIGLFGKQINQDLITLDTETTLIKIKGFTGKPESARRTYGEQFFFVNNRFMKHPYFHKAVVEAYHNILPADVIPAYFIFMEADPAAIDINIHPTKTEIKFEDERAIWQILMASVREALGRFNIVPSIDFENEALIDIPLKKTGASFPGQPEIRINPYYNPFDEEEGANGKTGSADRQERENISGWQKLYSGLEREAEGPGPENEKYPEAERKLFQIRNKYIISPVRSGLMLIDQKRAHERILYERYLVSLSMKNPAAQVELFPVTIELNQADWQILREMDNDLRILGYSIIFSESNKISVTSTPPGYSTTSPEEIFKIFIDEYKLTQNGPASGEKERLAAAMAGAAAIPYGRKLTHAEMEDIFDSLFACASPNYSPKGKPVVSIVSLEELDRKFK